MESNSNKIADDPSAMTCGTAVIEEFHSDRVGLGYNRPFDFLSPQWPCRKRWWYLLYRALVALALVGWTAGDMVHETHQFFGGSFYRWFLYATNWSLLLLTLSALVQAVTSCLYAYKSHWVIDPQFCRSMPLILRFQWLVLNLAYNSALVVTTAYWTWIVFIVDDLMLHRTPMNQLKHTANTLYVLLDLSLMATPIRLFHMFFSITLGSCYVLSNGLFFLNGRSLAMDTPGEAVPGTSTTTTSSGGGGTLSPGSWTFKSAGMAEEDQRDVYNYLNWHAPVEAIITCVMAMFLSVLAQMVLFLVFRLRLCLWQKIYGAAAWRLDAELQNIVMSQSSSYNTLDGTGGDDYSSRPAARQDYGGPFYPPAPTPAGMGEEKKAPLP